MVIENHLLIYIVAELLLSKMSKSHCDSIKLCIVETICRFIDRWSICATLYTGFDMELMSSETK